MEPYESKWADDTTRSFNMGGDKGLRPMSDVSNFDLGDRPDVRGWDVVGDDGGKIGEVNDLIVDTGEKEVRYLDVEAEKALERDGTDRHLLIPIGSATMDENEDKVVLRGVSREALEKCPQFSGCPITRDFERKIESSFINLDPGTANPSPGTDYNDDNSFYKRALYNPESFFRARRRK